MAFGFVLPRSIAIGAVQGTGYGVMRFPKPMA